MKIAHLCLSCFYFDGFSYQENVLPRQNIADGHETIIIASLESIDKNGKMIFLNEGSYLGSDGAMVYRIPYNKKIPKRIQHKVRSYQGLLDKLHEFKPDIIYFHGISAYELLTVKKYKMLNPNVKLIVDVHSDKNNSATNWISKYLLHKFFYRSVFKSIEPLIDKIFCCSLEAKDFAEEIYEADKKKTEFYPLGGECLSDQEYSQRRSETRSLLNIDDDKILLLQTGKINKKKKAIEALSVFSKFKSDKFIYLIIGAFEDNVEEQMNQLIAQDNRVRFLGWADSNQLKNYLCASDLYIQPGSQSATMQQSLCLRNPVLLDNVKSHTVFVKENGWLINDTNEINGILELIDQSPEILSKMSENSYSIAIQLLSYKSLANKIYF
ncbi:glycosyltransferase family 4 protein [Acinetobacter terrae]|uniref:Glycosyltransferase n=1 Tax=Acinetobacter terrae TaxID=2731247 RepID=A0A4R0EMZ1_9GAMM|nr:glycosyltransferase family 4 protein [Acinetobacter terrae]TCB59686.1 glycosyltransferase [Acinetobacter terrae]